MRIQQKSNYFMAFTLVSLTLAFFLTSSGCVSHPTHVKEAKHITKEPLSIESLPSNSNKKQVNLVYYVNGIRQSFKMIYLSYYDEKAKKEIKNTIKSDANGIARLLIPSGDDEASSVFRFALAESDLAIVTAIRIPPLSIYRKSGQKSITIRFDNQIRAENEGAPMQLIKFPSNGENVSSGGDIALPGSSIPLRKRR